jgi:hypothetical protein
MSDLPFGIAHYCLRPECPAFNLPRQPCEICPACGIGAMLPWYWDPGRDGYVREPAADQTGPRFVRQLEGVARPDSKRGDGGNPYVALGCDPANKLLLPDRPRRDQPTDHPRPTDPPDGTGAGAADALAAGSPSSFAMLVERREADFRRRAGMAPREYLDSDGADCDLRVLAGVLIADRRVIVAAGEELMAKVRALASQPKRCGEGRS